MIFRFKRFRVERFSLCFVNVEIDFMVLDIVQSVLKLHCDELLLNFFFDFAKLTFIP